MDSKKQTKEAITKPSETKPGTSSGPLTGYCNPPETTRFKPGQSGNRRGRPRGAKNRKTIVRKVANERHVVTEKGKQRRRTNLELVLIALRNLAIEGNVSAVRAYQAYMAKFDPQHRRVRGIALMPAHLTPEEFQAKAEKANLEARARREAKLRDKTA